MECAVGLCKHIDIIIDIINRGGKNACRESERSLQAFVYVVVFHTAAELVFAKRI